MDFADLSTFFERLEATPGRLEMTGILIEMLAELGDDEVLPAVRLMRGQVAPDWEGVELGLAEKLVLQCLARAAGLDVKTGGVAEATRVYHDAGDLGLAAQRLMERGGGAAQVGLMAFDAGAASAGLTVRDVFDRLHAIAAVEGAGSQDTKQKLLGKLLTDAGPREAKYVVRIVAGRLRLGVADMTLLDALAASHTGRGARSVQDMEPDERAAHEDIRARLERAYDMRSDLAVVAAALRTGGMDAVDALGIQVGTPLRPMAAERLKTLPEIFAKQTGVPVAVETDEGEGDDAGDDAAGAAGAAGTADVPVAPDAAVGMDYKYDGLRIQAHVDGDRVHLFSRRLEDLTSQFPDVADALRAAFPDTAVILEGEAVAVDPDGKLRPFQDISRRRGRKTGLGGDDVTTLAGQRGASAAYDITKDIPVRLFLFDVLAEDGRPCLAEPFETRRARVERLSARAAEAGVPAIQASTYRTAPDIADMETFFQEAVAEGAEGIMCKQLDAPYKAGSRGFAWIKFKTDYTEELVDTMDLVVVGAFYGRGRRAGWYGALLCAAHDDGTYRSVCKLGTGFDDALLQGLKDHFAPHIRPARPDDVDSQMEPDIWLAPAVVAEVQAAELSLSPIHRAAWGRLRAGAGLAARFPRFTRWRDDKAPEQATTVEELVTMYEAQGKRSG